MNLSLRSKPANKLAVRETLSDAPVITLRSAVLHTLNLHIMNCKHDYEKDLFLYLVHHQESGLAKMLVSPKQENVMTSHSSKW